MLVMQRREGESILIGAEVEIRILSIHGSRVKVGIAAPRSISVLAREVQLVRAENIAAAAVPSKAAVALIAGLFRQSPPETSRQSSDTSDKTA